MFCTLSIPAVQGTEKTAGREVPPEPGLLYYKQGPSSPGSTVIKEPTVEPFVRHTGKFVVLDRANIDTDAIIPARFLKKIERTGFGEHLFADVRMKSGRPDP